jgi:hypothetical protein
VETQSSGPRPDGSRSRRTLAVIAVLGVAGALLAGALVLLRRTTTVAPEATATPAPASRVSPSRTPPDAASAPGVVEIEAPDGAVVSVDGRPLGSGDQRAELAPGSHRVRVEQDGRAPFVRDVQIVPGHTVRLEARTEVEAPRLVVDADVPGAQVFLDRKFVGQTPVTLRDVAPGTHRLNLSAEGYEGHAEDVEVSAGTNEVMVRFKEVRLDERLAVTHKHGLGSCRGELVATADGLQYETDNAKDAFSLPWSALEPLEVDYLRKNLRVKQRDGRTYNFTADRADALLVFQKAVEKARARLG